MESRLLIGLGAVPEERWKRLTKEGHLPFLAFLRSQGPSGAVSFDPPPSAAAWWTTVATGQLAADHGVWMEPPGSRFHESTICPREAVWTSQRRVGRFTAVLHWPATAGPSLSADLYVGEAFLQGDDQAVTGVLPGVAGDLRVNEGEIHESVLAQLIPRWRETSGWAMWSRLRLALARLYTLHRVARAAVQTATFVAVYYEFLSAVERIFAGLDNPKSPWDRLEREILGGIGDRALLLQEMLLADLLGAAGVAAEFIIVTEPPLGEHPDGPWVTRQGYALSSPSGPLSPGGKDVWRAEDLCRPWLGEANPPSVGASDTSAVSLMPPIPPCGSEALAAFMAWHCHGAMALSTAKHWERASELAEIIQSTNPEHPGGALECVRAFVETGQWNAALEARETILDYGPIPSWAQSWMDRLPADLPHFQGHFGIRRPMDRWLDRLKVIAGEPSEMEHPDFLLLTVTGKVERIVAAVALTDVTERVHTGRAQFFVLPRWRQSPEALHLLLQAIDLEARIRGWNRWEAEILNAPLLAAGLSVFGLPEIQHDERWRVPFASLLARVSSAWQRILRRSDPNAWQVFSGEPTDRHWAQALELAEQVRLANPYLRMALANPEIARRDFLPALTEFVFHGEELAAVVLGRRLSPARAFINLRAVAPKFAASTILLNARVMLGPLTRGLESGYETLEYFARRNEEAESVAMGRRSQGICLFHRQILRRDLSPPASEPVTS